VEYFMSVLDDRLYVEADVEDEVQCHRKFFLAQVLEKHIDTLPEQPNLEIRELVCILKLLVGLA